MDTTRTLRVSRVTRVTGVGRAGPRRAALALATGVLALAVGTAPAVAAPRWTALPPEAPDSVLYDVSSADGATWAVGMSYGKESLFAPYAVRWDGTSWVTPPQPLAAARLDGVAVRAADDVWAVGADDVPEDENGALIQHWDGTAWEVVDLGMSLGASSRLNAIDVTPGGDLWAIGVRVEAGVEQPLALTLRAGQDQWEEVDMTGAGDVGFASDVLALAPDDVYVFGAGVAHFDGSGWKQQQLPGSVSGVLLDGATARARDDVWAVGHAWDETLGRHPVALHFDGAAWEAVPVLREPGQLFDIAFDATGTPVAVGETRDPQVEPEGNYVLTLAANGAFEHVEHVAGGGTLFDVERDGEGRLWAVGSTSAWDDMTPFAARRQ
ncbi:hypothetical protein [Streptomyces sp. SBT349]|uniref:hypothetical protein n=1 Tax=Streptomyces sp. SBT349 TaxID=1580539 RepID=UPI00066C68A5|nr:hypothetical protein [Streptomyces sp. SBT349]